MRNERPPASIITIGDELLIGQTVDTNSAWLADQLYHTGVHVTEICSISDEPNDLIHHLNRLTINNQIVFITGGLGPTNDDCTKKALSEFMKCPLVLNKNVLEDIKAFMVKKRGYLKLSENNRAQAMVVEKSTILRNPNGTAPVMVLKHNLSTIISMPGVPFEMKWLTMNKIIPFLKTNFELREYFYKTYHVVGYPESELANLLHDWEKNLQDGLRVAYLPSPGVIRLRLSEDNNNQQVITRYEQQLFKILGKNIVAEGKGKVEYLLSSILKSKNYTLSTAESCSGGKIAHRITSVPGSSQYFKGSIVAYSNEVKEQLLGVKPRTIEHHGAVSKQTALEMVHGVANRMKTNFAISTTGIAGPGGGTDKKPVGTVWIATYVNGEVQAKEYHFTHDRMINIERTATVAMYNLIEFLVNI